MRIPSLVVEGWVCATASWGVTAFPHSGVCRHQPNELHCHSVVLPPSLEALQHWWLCVASSSNDAWEGGDACHCTFCGLVHWDVMWWLAIRDSWAETALLVRGQNQILYPKCFKKHISSNLLDLCLNGDLSKGLCCALADMGGIWIPYSSLP